jgi:hypothetical protein
MAFQSCGLATTELHSLVAEDLRLRVGLAKPKLSVDRFLACFIVWMIVLLFGWLVSWVVGLLGLIGWSQPSFVLALTLSWFLLLLSMRQVLVHVYQGLAFMGLVWVGWLAFVGGSAGCSIGWLVGRLVHQTTNQATQDKPTSNQVPTKSRAFS